MQPLKILAQWLENHAGPEHYLFRFNDLSSLFPDMSESAFKALLSRAVKAGYLTRLCRGLYLDEKRMPKTGLLLYHAATQLRADHFNYLSLESVLSDAGVISQIPINWISMMSSGRSSLISCGKFGHIEFIHTNQKPNEIKNELTYDLDRGLWRASIQLALRDMKVTHRNCDLIDWELAHELIR
jgi:hypothetical protein